MIAKYKKQYFRVSLVKKPTRIWRYDLVEGFSKKDCGEGVFVCEKFVNMSELDEIFDVGFSALWNGRWCGVHYSAITDEVGLYSNDPAFAEKYGMRTIERFAYEIVVPANSVSQYKFIYRDALKKTEREEMISLDQLRVLWKQFYIDLMPPRK